MAEGAPNLDDLAETFKSACNVGVTGAQTKKTTITTSNVNKLFKNCGVYGKKLTSNSIDILFMKCKKEKTRKELNFAEFKELCAEAAKDYKVDKKISDDDAAKQEFIAKLNKGIDCSKGTTKTSKTGGVEKMTDTKNYTGAHKERFGEDGKGKGAAGRKDEVNTSGYVGAYKGEGTHGKK